MSKNRFVILFRLSKLVFFLFAFEKRGLCDPTLPFIKTVGPEVYKEEISIMLVRKVTIAIGAWVLCSLTRHARLYVPTNLAANLNARKSMMQRLFRKKEVFIPLPAPE